MLLDKEGKAIMTVDEHNDKVRADIAKTIGRQSTGMGDASENVALLCLLPGAAAVMGDQSFQNGCIAAFP